MNVFAIDPGNIESAYIVLTENEDIVEFGKVKNEELRQIILNQPDPVLYLDTYFAIEHIASYGMPVGKEVFDTCIWIGRFSEIIEHNYATPPTPIYRKDVKMHLCHSMKAKDANIRQALMDRFGSPGTKKKPGKTYGISKDLWAAFGVAITYLDQLSNNN